MARWAVALRRRVGAGTTGRAVAVGLVVLVAVLVPLVRAERHDSFPLSNYPMFTSDKPSVTSFVRAIGVRDDGTEEVLPPEIAGGTIEVIHANRTLGRAIREGRAVEMCGEIAARTAGDKPDVATVLIVTEDYDVIDALRADAPVPVSRAVLAECPVDAE